MSLCWTLPLPTSDHHPSLNALCCGVGYSLSRSLTTAPPIPLKHSTNKINSDLLNEPEKLLLVETATVASFLNCALNPIHLCIMICCTSYQVYTHILHVLVNSISLIVLLCCIHGSKHSLYSCIPGRLEH